MSIVDHNILLNTIRNVPLKTMSTISASIQSLLLKNEESCDAKERNSFLPGVKVVRG